MLQPTKVQLDLRSARGLIYTQDPIRIGTGEQQHFANVEPGGFAHFVRQFATKRRRLFNARRNACRQFYELANSLG